MQHTMFVRLHWRPFRLVLIIQSSVRKYILILEEFYNVLYYYERRVV
jgi:hypothetical protein